MPKVGSKHFAYSPKGRAAARSYGKKTGQKVTNTRRRGARKR